jgi:hypothetical protein
MVTSPSMLIGAGSKHITDRVLPEVLLDQFGMSPNATTNIQNKVKAQAAREIPVEKQPKPKYKSLTIWAGILSIVTGTADFITNFTVEDAVQVHRILVDVGALLGGLGAIYGRIRARRVVQ